MPTATTTTTTATALTAVSNSNNVLQIPSQRLACVVCEIEFDQNITHREHMKLQWHFYNLRRQLALLPPLPQSIFNAQIISEHDIEDSESEHIEYDAASPYQCLFCPQTFSNDTQGLQDNYKHMKVAHGFHIQDIALVIDLESLLGYLATSIREWHECLFCNTKRDSTAAIQSHMRDKGHCKLNLEREPELLDFWEERSDETNIQPPLVDLLVIQPRVAASRSSQGKRTARSNVTTVSLRAAAPKPKGQASRQIARRDEMGLYGLAPQQQQALVVALKRSQKEEAIGMRASEWSYARKANKQKHDQAHGPLSWAKGGMHNLLPR